MELVADLRRVDDQMRDAPKQITAAVKASKTTLTELFGVGPTSSPSSSATSAMSDALRQP